MQDIAEFLRAHPPFDSLDEETLARMAESAEIEFHAARTVILNRAAGLHGSRRGGHARSRGHGTVRALTSARRDVRARQLWHGPEGLRPG